MVLVNTAHYNKEIDTLTRPAATFLPPVSVYQTRPLAHPGHSLAVAQFTVTATRSWLSEGFPGFTAHASFANFLHVTTFTVPAMLLSRVVGST